MRFLGIRALLNRIRVIPFFMKDKTVPVRKKLLVVLGILYVFIPIDIIPFIPLDDVIVLGLIIWYLRKELDKYWLGDDSGDLSGKFNKKDMVHDVDFEVYEGGKKDPVEDDGKNSHEDE